MKINFVEIVIYRLNGPLGVNKQYSIVFVILFVLSKFIYNELVVK